jgi:hypothetical protein
MKRDKLRASSGSRHSVHMSARLPAAAVIAAGAALGFAAGEPPSAGGSPAGHSRTPTWRANAADAKSSYWHAVLSERSLVSYWRSADRRRHKWAADRTHENSGRYKHGPLRGVRVLLPDATTPVRYDGSNDQIRVRDRNSLDLTSRFTLEAWIKPRSARKNSTIIRKNKAYLLKTQRKSLRMTFWDRHRRRRTVVAADRLAVRSTSHVVGTYGNGILRLYVNGELVAFKRLRKKVTARQSHKPLWIGRYGSARRGGAPFHGVIDEVAIYNAAHGRRKVAARYAAGARTNRQSVGGELTRTTTPPARNAPPPLWSGDFETGGFGQYDVVQEASEERIALVSAARKGRYAARFTANDGDLQGGSNPRAQLSSRPLHFPGQEHYIGWSTYFPADFPAIRGEGAFFVFFYFNGEPFSGSPPIGFNVDGDGRIALHRNQQYGFDRLWSMPLPRGRWIDFVAHVKWSKSASDGFVELWVDGVPQSLTNGQRRVHMQTVMSDQDAGLKTIVTNYRRQGTIPGAVTVYHDEVKVGTSYDSVAP